MPSPGSSPGLAAFFYLGTTTGQVGYDYGFSPLLKGLVAAVIGGLGSLSGAVLGGFILAGLEIFFQVTLPAEKTPFSTAIVFGIVDPRSPVPAAGRARRPQRAGRAGMSSEAPPSDPASAVPVASQALTDFWVVRALAGGGLTSVLFVALMIGLFETGSAAGRSRSC